MNSEQRPERLNSGRRVEINVSDSLQLSDWKTPGAVLLLIRCRDFPLVMLECTYSTLTSLDGVLYGTCERIQCSEMSIHLHSLVRSLLVDVQSWEPS